VSADNFYIVIAGWVLQVTQPGSSPEWLPLLNTVLTLLLGGVVTFGGQYLLTRVRTVRTDAEVAKANADTAKTRVDVIDARFQVSEKEWKFATARLEWLMNRNEELEAKVSVLQSTIDNNTEMARKRIDGLELIIERLEAELAGCKRLIEATFNHIEDLYASLALEPVPIRDRIKGRLRTKRPFREPHNSEGMKTTELAPEPEKPAQ
jgi:cell division protein FtsB